MRFFILLISFGLLFNVSSNLYSQEKVQPKYDIRKANWGMTKDEVKKSESAQLMNEDFTTVQYNTDLGSLYYYFTVEDKLFSAKFVQEDFYQDTDEYINHYERIKSAFLGKSYVVKSCEEKWKKGKVKTATNTLANALFHGDVRLNCVMQNQKTYLEMLLYKDVSNQKTILIIKYESISMHIYEKERKEKELIDNL